MLKFEDMCNAFVRAISAHNNTATLHSIVDGLQQSRQRPVKTKHRTRSKNNRKESSYLCIVCEYECVSVCVFIYLQSDGNLIYGVIMTCLILNVSIKYCSDYGISQEMCS